MIFSVPLIGVLHLYDDVHLPCCLCLRYLVQLTPPWPIWSAQLIPANRQRTLCLLLSCSGYALCTQYFSSKGNATSFTLKDNHTGDSGA